MVGLLILWGCINSVEILANFPNHRCFLNTVQGLVFPIQAWEMCFQMGFYTFPASQRFSRSPINPFYPQTRRLNISWLGMSISIIRASLGIPWGVPIWRWSESPPLLTEPLWFPVSPCSWVSRTTFLMDHSAVCTTQNIAWLSSAPHPGFLGFQIQLCPCNPVESSLGASVPSPFLLWYRVQTSTGLKTC